MKILLTGANGFLGKYINRYISRNNEVFTLSRSNTSDFMLDLSDSIPIFNQKFDIVIHSAGKVHSIPKNKFEIEEMFKVNVLGTENLLSGLIMVCLPKHLVFISSVSVYGLFFGININENSPLLAKDSYGKSKIEAESVVKNWCNENNIICTILRLPLLVGSNPPGNLGAMIDAIRNNFYFNISGGTARKSMVLASDVAKFILKAAEVGGTYNLTDGYHPNFNELSRYIGVQLGKSYIPNMSSYFSKIFAFIGDKLGQKFPINSNKLNKITSTLTFDDSKARKAVGWDSTPVLKGFKIDK